MPSSERPTPTDLPTSAAIPGVLTGVGPDVAPKFVVQPRIAPKAHANLGTTHGISLATGERTQGSLDCEGIDVEAVRLCTDHDTPLDAEQRCSHGHVARSWRVEVNGRIQYDGRKFSSVDALARVAVKHDAKLRGLSARCDALASAVGEFVEAVKRAPRRPTRRRA